MYFQYTHIYIYLSIYRCIEILIYLTASSKIMWGPSKRTLFGESLGVAMPYFNRSIEVRSAWCGPAAALNALRPWAESGYKRIARLSFTF